MPEAAGEALGHGLHPALLDAALRASDGALIVVRSRYYALAGIASLLAAIGAATGVGRGLGRGGAVLTFHDPGVPVCRQVEGQLRELLGSDVFRAVIPRDGDLSGRGLEGSAGGAVSRPYAVLADELLARRPVRSLIEAV